jgi:hypothetical protein
MGLKWTAKLNVEFEMMDGQPDSLARVVLAREVAQFQSSIERGREVARTGVKPGSAKVKVVSEGPA